MSAYFTDVLTLARKDLRLEVRARSGAPAMLLFVVATRVVHRADPAGAEEAHQLVATQPAAERGRGQRAAERVERHVAHAHGLGE